MANSTWDGVTVRSACKKLIMCNPKTLRYPPRDQAKSNLAHDTPADIRQFRPTSKDEPSFEAECGVDTSAD